ncbi:SAM-dependent methyltransferase [Staphylococcus chromogenes]|nr:SAM-dependent methyltransferase [Staphylococcus chromogenes]
MAAVNREYFEKIYADSDDPWGFAHSEYERRKYRLTLASLPKRRYQLGFEPGCSIGVLTGMLADVCDRVEAWEPIEAPRAQAASCAANVTVLPEALRPGAPIPAADLVVLSEVLYYLSPADLTETLAELTDGTRIPSGATIVAVHWRHPIPDMELSGDQVHELLRSHPKLTHLGGWTERDFLLDVFAKG